MKFYSIFGKTAYWALIVASLGYWGANTSPTQAAPIDAASEELSAATDAIAANEIAEKLEATPLVNQASVVESTDTSGAFVPTLPSPEAIQAQILPEADDGSLEVSEPNPLESDGIDDSMGQVTNVS